MYFLKIVLKIIQFKSVYTPEYNASWPYMFMLLQSFFVSKLNGLISHYLYAKYQTSVSSQVVTSTIAPSTGDNCVCVIYTLVSFTGTH